MSDSRRFHASFGKDKGCRLRAAALGIFVCAVYVVQRGYSSDAFGMSK